LRNKELLILFLSFFYQFEASCQSTLSFTANIKDTVFIAYSEGKYYLHQYNKKKNLIKIPILYKDIKSPGPLKSYEKNVYIPVYYQIKKGDTNYRILKIYFPRDSTEIKKHNLIQSNLIKEGVRILIGYYPIQFEKQKEINFEDTAKLTMEKIKKTLVLISGPANTFVPPIEKTPYPFVLSNKIPEHTVIEIMNPMTKKTILAKVIGKIPPGKYPLDILLLLSKNDAIKLGFIDVKFFISAKYYK
jgi:hypothetical protein